LHLIRRSPRSRAHENDGIPIVCKIDCEGCEFEIFSQGTMQPDAMKFVSQIMIEYHWKSPDRLLEFCGSLA